MLLLTGDTLFQMAEVHRQIQVQLEDVVRLDSAVENASLRVFFIWIYFLNHHKTLKKLFF